MVKDLTYRISDKESLDVTTFCKNGIVSDKVVILVHGFKGFKDWGAFPYTANFFAENGFFVITFNFSHNGIGSNPVEFTEFEKFAKNTFSREIFELNELINAVRNNYFECSAEPSIFLIGHSRGGGISLLTAAKRDDLSGLALWASVATFDRYSERQKIEWRKKGSFDVMNMRTKQVFKLSVSLLDDLEKNADTLSIERAVKNLDIPLFIAHGDQDLAVPIKEAEEVYNWSKKSNTEYLKIIGTGHTFDIVHPFEGSNHKFEKLLDSTNRFFLKNLK
jgi:uncharacterized protein